MEGRPGTVKKIVIATKNKGKVREMINAFSELDVELVSLAQFGDLPDAVEDGRTFAENALIKARFYAAQTGCACLADDSGLEVDILGGAPGVYSARFAGEQADDAMNNAKLVSELAKANCSEAAARYRCVLAFVDTDGTERTTSGTCEGTVRREAAGEQGFGYDPYFYVESSHKTMAQLTLAEKDEISHRGMALRRMAKELAAYRK